MQTQQQPAGDQPTGNAIIKVNPTLREKCLRPGDPDDAAQQAIANAEQALQQLSVNFDDWMLKESTQLTSARDAAKQALYSEETLTELFQAAHNLKGQASTLGYPFADEICASLCRLIEKTDDITRLPTSLVDQHVDAVRALVHEGAKGNDNPTASVLAKRLRDVTNDFLQQKSPSPATS